jgi:uncharacterized glyoxalase superfamily protein PhnB
MAARKPARGRKKKSASSRSRPVSRKRKSAPKKVAGRKKKVAGRKTVARKKTQRAPARKKAVRARKKTAKAPATRRKTVGTGRKTVRKKATARSRTPRKGAPVAHTVVPSAIGMHVQHLDYTSHAMDEVRSFYTETLGFAEFSLNGDYLIVRTGHSSSVGFMPPVPGPPDQWRPPREPALYFMVEDVDRVYRELTAQGVEFDQAPQDTFWGHRLAMLRDPEGRTVCLAHVIKE